jgi:ubiquinone biosynthesis monooxygenase Coq7
MVPPENRKPRMPGDESPEDRAARIIRVDQAGEYGAKRIYAGQLAVMGHTRSGASLRHMAQQEDEHLNAFNRMMTQRTVRPTLLSPLWHVAGYALGAATALLGERAAMACTVAVEEAIDAHYTRQQEELGEEDAELSGLIAKCHAEELEHRDRALEQGAEDLPGYALFSGLIRAGARTAIWLSERV